jgi:Fur family transcriptional regulator, peroxide stress response regulator
VKIISTKVHGDRRSARDDEGVKNYFMSQCRSRGIRVTTQRLAVFQALARTVDHPTVDVLYAQLRTAMPSLSLSTVYRILESLEGEGLIRRVVSTNGVVRYDGNHRPHQHLVCRVCGCIMDITSDLLRDPPMLHADYNGFIAEELDVRIVGICAECRPVSKSSRSLKKKTTGRRTVSHKEEEREWQN